MKKINRKYYDPDSKAYDPCCKYGNMTLTVKNMAMTVKNMTLTVKYMNLNLTVKNMTLSVGKVHVRNCQGLGYLDNPVRSNTEVSRARHTLYSRYTSTRLYKGGKYPTSFIAEPMLSPVTQ